MAECVRDIRKLTTMVKTGGCAAKLNPIDLHRVLGALAPMPSEHLVEGFEGSDDALVWSVTDDIVAIETVDFFPPMVDDPYTFGQIAAANALSDIYAMGASPAVAMNLLCFPACQDLSAMQDILKGGQNKVAEAGAVIAGGHTISDPTPKYGMCVTAFAKKSELWNNAGAKKGDVLVFTKALGTGVMVTAYKGGDADDEHLKLAIDSMVTLNKEARDRAHSLGVHAATDVTGFGMIGHSLQMAKASGVTFEIEANRIPLLDGVLEFARFGWLPEGMYHNQEYGKGSVYFNPALKTELQDLMSDPQTSGGLLLSMSQEDAESYGYPIIGRVVEKGDYAVKFL